MWRRLRRRTLGPRRPAVFRDQAALAVLTATVLLASAGFALYVAFGGR